jgi:hypothetical protein
MKAQITLEIVFDEKTSASPESWDWHDLLDLWGDEESVTVISYEEE